MVRRGESSSAEESACAAGVETEGSAGIVRTEPASSEGAGTGRSVLRLQV